ncbi:MAG: hypothetical protein PVG07_12575, partial [Acidobacteriota bacterium]
MRPIRFTLAFVVSLSVLVPLQLHAEDPAPDPPDRRWVLSIQGNPAGEITLREIDEEDGRTEVWHAEFNDRGRGPDLTTRITYGGDGRPTRIGTRIGTRIETVGHDYLKAPVEESFVRDGATARWSTTDGSGERTIDGPAFYLSADSGAPEQALLARALMTVPGHALPLLPEGEARLDVLGTRQVGVGDRSETLTHVAITGLGFTPSTLWLDADGGFFAVLDGWFTVIPEGWEPVAEILAAADRRAEQAFFASLPKRLGRAPAALAVVGADVFDPSTGEVAPGRTVLVEGDRITAVGPDGDVEIPEGAERIDAGGRTLLPGLWDLHVHASPQDGLLHLAAGVTSVRDLANDVDRVTRLR